MHRGSGEYDGMFVIEFDSASIEFVLTNGEGDWDSPDPSTNHKNYTIRSHGTYRVKSGKVSKLS